MTGGFEKNLLSGKRALITGGGTGLGKAIGRRYLELGADLAICGRRLEVLQATAREFEQAFGRPVQIEICDIRSAEAVEAMMDRVWAQGGPDILVNNAAGNFIAQSHKLSARALDAVLNTCLHGTAYCTIAAGRRWIETKRPAVVLSILTLSALHGSAFTLPNAMSKAGIDAMTKSLAVEWGLHGIRLVAVAPGNFPTEGASARLTPTAGGAPIDPGVPLRRDGRHDELADLCAFVVSDLAGYVTGETIVIDGAKRWLAGSRAGVSQMLDWSDEDWARQRASMPGARK
ncbi:MAG: SDR family oxidoreductase [Hyphomicrobiales bacterium]|nr:SDR family oxidoreductase [Hyphomicrobiales bacterium]